MGHCDKHKEPMCDDCACHDAPSNRFVQKRNRYFFLLIAFLLLCFLLMCCLPFAMKKMKKIKGGRSCGCKSSFSLFR